MGELTLDSPQISLEQKIIDKSKEEFQTKARRAEEPQFAHMKVGHCFEVFSPVYRMARVDKIAGNSCQVTARVRRNVPRYTGEEYQDHWEWYEWQEIWALREFNYTSNDGLRHWTESHVVVTQENRPLDYLRFQSPLVDTSDENAEKHFYSHVLAVRMYERLWDQVPEGEKLNAVEDIKDGQWEGIRSDEGDGAQAQQETDTLSKSKGAVKGAARKS